VCERERERERERETGAGTLLLSKSLLAMMVYVCVRVSERDQRDGSVRVVAIVAMSIRYMCSYVF